LAQSERLLALLTSVYGASNAGHDLIGHPGETTAPMTDRPAPGTRSTMAVCAQTIVRVSITESRYTRARRVPVLSTVPPWAASSRQWRTSGARLAQASRSRLANLSSVS